MAVTLTPQQERVVSHGDGALLVIAGPGTGKTRVVAERVRRLLRNTEGNFRILALTFTNKAANEMKDRLQDCPEARERSFIGTIHSFCLEVLENRGKSIGLPGGVNIQDTYQARIDILASAIRDDPTLVQLLLKEGEAKEQTNAVSRWLGMIRDYKAQLITPDLVEDLDERAIYEAYDAAMRASSSVDFDDLLLLTYRILEDSPKIAAFYRRLYRYILVDEAQDMNEAQYRLLCALCGAEHRNVMLVGDPKQAIYVWNGASQKYLEMFEADFGAERIELLDNFRSSKSVVEAAQLLDSSYAIEGQIPIGGELGVQSFADEATEADGICAKISSLLKDGHPDIEGDLSLQSFAVLGRNRYVFGKLEEALASRGLSFYKKFGGRSSHSESDVMQAFELALRVISNPHDRLHFGRLANALGVSEDMEALRTRLKTSPLSGVDLVIGICKLGTRDYSDAVGQAVSGLRTEVEQIQFTASLDLLTKHVDGLDEDTRALAQQDLAAWNNQWNQFLRLQSGGTARLRPFLSQLALGSMEQAQGDGIALLTVHSSKGMEFDVVFVMGLCDGVFPDYRATGAAMAEEDRNAFVAVSRAKRLLFLSYPRQRLMPWGDLRRQQPSKYFSLLDGSVS